MYICILIKEKHMKNICISIKERKSLATKPLAIDYLRYLIRNIRCHGN